MEIQKKRRGIKTIIAGTVMMVTAFVAPLVLIVFLFLGDSAENQFKAPGSIELKIEEPGAYTVWNDYSTSFDGMTYRSSQELPHGTRITVTGADGSEIPAQMRTGFSSSSGDYHKESFAEFEVLKPQSVEIRIDGSFPERIFSVSQSGLLSMGLFIPILLIFAITSFPLTIAGLGLIIWGIVKLVRSR